MTSVESVNHAYRLHSRGQEGRVICVSAKLARDFTSASIPHSKDCQSHDLRSRPRKSVVIVTHKTSGYTASTPGWWTDTWPNDFTTLPHTWCDSLYVCSKWCCGGWNLKMQPPKHVAQLSRDTCRMEGTQIRTHIDGKWFKNFGHNCCLTFMMIVYS